MGGALQGPAGDGEGAAPVRKIPYRRMMEVDIKREPNGARYPARRQPNGSKTRAHSMNHEFGRYVVSIQSEAIRKKMRYHWMICRENNPDELISWGHAPTQELAEAEARHEVNDLTSGATQGGRVASTSYSAIHHF